MKPVGIKINSDNCTDLGGFCSGAEAKQTLSIHLNGKVYWNRYFLGRYEEGKMPWELPLIIKRKIVKIDGKQAEQLINEIKAILDNHESFEELFDGGMWNAEVRFEGARNLTCMGSLGASELVQISDTVRKTLSLPEAWVFAIDTD